MYIGFNTFPNWVRGRYISFYRFIHSHKGKGKRQAIYPIYHARMSG